LRSCRLNRVGPDLFANRPANSAKVTLQYGCLCGNNLQPNVSEYSLTLPFFVCQEWGVQCVKNCGTSSSCASACLQNHPCGAQNPIKVNTTTSSTMTSTAFTAGATTANQVFTGLAGQSTSTSRPGSAAPPSLEFGSAYGLGIVMASMFAGFAMML
jgi:hypothetical protein